MEYTRDVKISEIEWLLIQRFRSLLSNRFGTLMVAKVKDGKVSGLESEIEIKVKFDADTKELVRIQQ